MKRSIGRKLTTSGLMVLLFIVLIFIVSQVAVKLFKNTSENLIIEYHELDAIQEFRVSLSMLLISSNYFAHHREQKYKSQFCDEILVAKTKLRNCYEVITNRHNKNILSKLEDNITELDRITTEMQGSESANEVLMDELLHAVEMEIDSAMISVNDLLDQTKEEILEYEGINKTVIRHSTYTFLSLGILVILILMIRGLIVIRSVVKPIRELVRITTEIGKGNKNLRADVHTNDEFSTLAHSINEMVSALENTTVSRDYLNNILENMFDALLVTNGQLKIKSANQAAYRILEYDEEHLKGKDIFELFEQNPSQKNTIPKDKAGIEDLRASIQRKKSFYTRSGQCVPASVSCGVLKGKKDEFEGLIIVSHDLSEQHKVERKLEQIRRERLMAINEAQEEERMRIATDLHDGMGQILTSISYLVQELSADEPGSIEQRNDVITSIRQQLETAIKEAKSIAHDLIPIVLKDFGLIVAIENLIRKANDAQQTKFQFSSFDFNERIDPRLEKGLYRICQESVNNILKHAKAKNAVFQIYRQNQNIILVIEDDGIGFDTEHKENNPESKGIGLISIRERVAAFDGSLTLNSSPDFGTEIIVEIPCRKA